MYKPSEQNLIPEILPTTAKQVGGSVTRALQDREERKRQSEYARGLVDVLGSSGDNNQFDLGRALSLIRNSAAESPDRIGGAMSGLQIIGRLLDQQKQNEIQRDQLGFVPSPSDFDRAHGAGYELVPTGHGRYKAVPSGKTSTEPSFTPTPEQIREGAASGLKWLPTSRGQGRWVEDPNNTANQSKTKAAPGDSWEALNKDVFNATGAHLGDWNSAANHRIEGDQFLADNPAAGKALKMPVPIYEQFLGRYNALQNGGTAPRADSTQDAPAGPAVQTPGVPGGGRSSGVNPTVALSQARAKINAGADAALVRQRLQELGVDPSGL